MTRIYVPPPPPPKGLSRAAATRIVPREPPFVPNDFLWMRSTIDAVGRTLFPHDWTGNEIYARAIPPLTGDDVAQDAQLRLHGRGQFNFLNSPAGGSEDGPATREDYASESNGARRYGEAVNWLRQRWWSGELSVHRFDNRMWPVQAARWGDGKFFRWATEYGTSNRSDESGHLFVRKSDLAGVLAPSEQVAESPSTTHKPAGAAPPSNQKADRRKPGAERHARWIVAAREVRKEHSDWGLSKIARKVRSRESKIADPAQRGKSPDERTIRRYLHDRRSEWDSASK